MPESNCTGPNGCREVEESFLLVRIRKKAYVQGSRAGKRIGIYDACDVGRLECTSQSSL